MTPHRMMANDIVYGIPLAEVIELSYVFTGMVNRWMLASMSICSISAVLLVNMLARRLVGRFVQVLLAYIFIIYDVKIFLN